MMRGVAVPIGLVVLLAACCAPGMARAAEPPSIASGGAATASAARSVISYWTPARMREAIRHSEQSDARARARAARAAGAQPAVAQLPGMKAIGRVFFVNPAGENRACTGTLVDSRNRSVVWTAGHCVHSGHGGAFHTNFAFAPGYQPQVTGNPTPYGLWPAFRTAVAGSWAKKGIALERDRRGWRTAQYDMAGLVLVRDPAGRPAADVVGVTQHIRFRVRKSRSMRVFGYPAAPPYNGETLMQCGPARTRTFRYAVNLFAIPCPLTHGMSGGPALTRVDATGVGTVIGEMTVTDFRRIFVAFQGRESRRLYRYLDGMSN